MSEEEMGGLRSDEERAAAEEFNSRQENPDATNKTAEGDPKDQNTGKPETPSFNFNMAAWVEQVAKDRAPRVDALNDLVGRHNQLVEEVKSLPKGGSEYNAKVGAQAMRAQIEKLRLQMPGVTEIPETGQPGTRPKKQ